LARNRERWVKVVIWVVVITMILSVVAVLVPALA
jgi:ABC-type glycerol-3-phosphate transport system permease component